MQMTLFKKGTRQFSGNTENVKNKNYKQDMLVHASNSGTLEAEKENTLVSLKPGWFTRRVSGQSGSHSETLFQK